ncbi:MAG TPA: acyl-CoA dehydrogenase [Actinoplanes sp.]|nr:acyl-CoA dehydrogenase [Actinoplanes sp.]
MTTPASRLLSRRDLDFLLYEWLRVDELTTRDRFAEHTRETFDAVLDLCAELAEERFAPHFKAGDQHEPTLDGDRVSVIPEVKQALEALGRAGVLGAAMDASIGGLQLPATVAAAGFAWFQAANIATSAYAGLTIGNANLLMRYAGPEQIDTWVRPMVEGRFTGTMCLSEPHAGSSLAELTTRAESRPDGTYRLFGTKMWISGGDHDMTENIVHLVLARIPGAPDGVRGISLFLVPKHLTGGERNDVVAGGLNHKMGNRGTVNVLLNLGEGRYRPGGLAGAVGYLVGEPNRGLAAMFHMMNEARIGVGAGAMAVGYTGYLKSVQYARERLQGRRARDRGATGPQVPIIEHPDVRRMLLAQKSYVEGALALILYGNRLLDEAHTGTTPQARADATRLLDTLTPISKAWPSQWCLAANDLAIQVHGGYGYTRDYDVEQHYRDNRLNLIHEGTNTVQGLDLLGRKVTADDGAGLRALLRLISGTAARAVATGGDLREYGGTLAATAERIGEVTAKVWAAEDVEVTLANSAAYLDAVGHTVVGWLWLEQALVAGDREDDFYAGKRHAARYFFRYEMPKVTVALDLLESLDRTLIDLDPAWF